MGVAQAQTNDSVQAYKKRVLESVEIDFLTSYYMQNGDNAAVSGGIGSEKLSDAAGAIEISIPLNDDDVLTIDASVSAYTSASSSNINPFDGKRNTADPFTASSGASRSDIWSSYSASYEHSSDDRNNIWSAKGVVSTEFDYFSVGAGGSYARLFNEKNTELGVSANVFLDTWSLIYPVELRKAGMGEYDDDNTPFNIDNYTITGNQNYNPSFVPFDKKGRNSYSLGFIASQIMSKKLQGSMAFDFVKQEGLLSTPFQRVYFGDKEDSFIYNFQLADDVERLPGSRLKIAFGGRLNCYINEMFVVRTFYRYYSDNWGIYSHTASIELPVKISDKFTLYPSYRFYNQTASKYFAPYNQNLSTNLYYTSDYDLSEYNANQYGVGIAYTDLLTRYHIWKFALKNADLKYNHYTRNSSFRAEIVTGSVKFIFDY